MRSDRFTKFILSHEPPIKRTRAYVIVCEGLRDAGFISALLVRNKIDVYDVGCPSKNIGGGQGKDKIGKYLQALAANPTGLQGVVVVADTDGSARITFRQMASAFGSVAPLLPIPTKPFAVTGGNVRSAVFLIPKKGTRGTLEHLLLEAAFEKEPKMKECLERFCRCAGGSAQGWTTNNRAKMKVAALIAASCKQNPACSTAYVWAQAGNPFPISSSSFDHITSFLIDFAR